MYGNWKEFSEKSVISPSPQILGLGKMFFWVSLDISKLILWCFQGVTEHFCNPNQFCNYWIVNYIITETILVC